MRFIMFAAGSLFFVSKSVAQTPPLPPGIPLTTATVSVVVGFGAMKNIFTYSYVLSNSRQSLGNISSFDLDISTRAGGAVLSSDGLLNSATGYSGIGARNLESQVQSAIIPVGFHSQPAGWASGPTVQLTANWFGPPNIPPGESLGGFVLTSHGLPGIRRFIAKPVYDPNDFLPSVDEASDEELKQMTILAQAIPRVIQSQGLTIAPDDPSSQNAGPLIDRLISLKDQSASLDWLRGKEFIDELDEKLDQAKKAFAENKPFDTRHKLREFIHKLEEQRKEQFKRQHEASEEGREEREEHSEDDKKFVGDNAFYLLKPNAEFIISKLPAKPSADDDRDDNAAPEDRH